MKLVVQYIGFILFCLFSMQCIGQTHYSRHYDLAEYSYEFAQDAVEYEGRLFLVFQHAALEDSIQSMMVGELDDQGDFIWTKSFQGVEVLWKSPMLIENDTIYLFGYNRPVGDLIYLFKLDLDGDLVEELNFSAFQFDLETIVPRGVMQNTFENKIIIYGGSYNVRPDSLELFNFISSIDLDGSVDTVITFPSPRGGNISEVVYNSKENTFHAIENKHTWRTTPGGTFAARQWNLYSFDTSYNIIDEWNSEVIIGGGVGKPSLGILSDGQIIIAGSFESIDYSDVWTINDMGEQEFIVRLTNDFSPIVKIADIAVTSNDDILITGSLPYSPEITGIDSERLPYLGLISKEGALLWERLFYYDDAYEQRENGFFFLNEILNDGSIFVGGVNDQHYMNDNNELDSHYDMWLAKVDSDGCIEGECEYRLVDVDEVVFERNEVLQVFPNPTNNIINIDLPADVRLSVIHVLNNFGKLIFTAENNFGTIDCSMLTKGVYWIIAEDVDGKRFESRFVKI